MCGEMWYPLPFAGGRDPVSSPNRKTLFRYLAFARPYRWLVAAVVVAGVAKFTLPLIPAYIFRRIIDEVIRNDTALDEAARLGLLKWLGSGLVAVAVLATVAIYFRGLCTVKISSSIAFDMRASLWGHLQRLSLSFHQSRPTGSLLSRLMSDVGVSQQMIHGGIMNVAIDLASGTIALVVLLSISWQLTLLVLAVLPIYGVMYRRINPRLRQASHDVQEQTAMMSGAAVERLNGIAIVQSFAQEPAESRYFAEQADELRGRFVRRGKLNNTLKAISELLMAMGTGAVWIAGAYLAIDGRLSAGRIIQFLGTAALLYMPIRRLSEINITYQTSMAAIERVFKIFDVVPEVQSRPHAPDHRLETGRIDFEHVSFRYDDGPEILKDLSFSVASGERVAIVGESGAGKSTLVTLIPRLYDVSSGTIRIDGIDIQDFPLRQLRRNVGIVLQDTILFSGTVRENLRYGRKKANDAEIIAAAKAANAHPFICELAEGYDALIGERGLTLSGGQRQRISLARTVLQDPRILILDEATSSLDSESENLITAALERVMAGRTCLIIAHRLSTVISADRIIALRGGQIVESGTHAELLAEEGYYSHLFDQQFGPLQKLVDQSRQVTSGPQTGTPH